MIVSEYGMEYLGSGYLPSSRQQTQARVWVRGGVPLVPDFVVQDRDSNSQVSSTGRSHKSFTHQVMYNLEWTWESAKDNEED